MQSKAGTLKGRLIIQRIKGNWGYIQHTDTPRADQGIDTAGKRGTGETNWEKNTAQKNK